MAGNIQAFWGYHIFTTSERHIRSIVNGLQLSSELNVEQQSATEAQNPLNIKGGNKQRSFQIKTVSASGGDPLLEYNQLVRDCGMSLPFIVGYMPFGGLRVILQKVSMSDVEFGPSGILSAALTMDFIEDMQATVRAKEVKKDNKGIAPAEKKAKADEAGLTLKKGK